MVARVFANSELLSAKRLEFDAAGVTEFAKNVDRAVRQHVAQLRKRLVGSKIGIDDRSAYPVGFFCDPERRLDAHAAYLRINADKGVKIGLVVLQRIHIAFRGIFDEVSVQFLAAQSILCDPLRPDLSALRKPGCKDRCQPADRSANQSGEGRNNRYIHGNTSRRAIQGFECYRRMRSPGYGRTVS